MLVGEYKKIGNCYVLVAGKCEPSLFLKTMHQELGLRIEKEESCKITKTTKNSKAESEG